MYFKVKELLEFNDNIFRSFMFVLLSGWLWLGIFNEFVFIFLSGLIGEFFKCYFDVFFEVMFVLSCDLLYFS